MTPKSCAPLLHGRLRPSRVDDGLLAQAAAAGRRPCRNARSPQRLSIVHRTAWPLSHPSTSRRPSISRKSTTPSTRRGRKSRSATTSRARARRSISIATENTLTLTADDEFKMNALWEILQTRMVRRGVPTKNLTPGDDRARRQRHRPADGHAAAGHPHRSGQRDRQVPEGPEAEEGPGRDPGRPGPRHLAVQGRAAGGDAPAPRARLRRARCSSATTGADGLRSCIAAATVAICSTLSTRLAVALACPLRAVLVLRRGPAAHAGAADRRASTRTPPPIADFLKRVNAYVALHKKLEADAAGASQADRRRSRSICTSARSPS